MMGKNGVGLVEYNKFEIHRKMKKGGLKVSGAGYYFAVYRRCER